MNKRDMDNTTETLIPNHTLPPHWRIIRMEELGAISGGSTPSTKVHQYWGGEVPWLTPSEVTKHEGLFVSHTERYITKEGLSNCSAKLLPIGTVMMTSRATIGEAVINTEPMVTNQGFINIICNDSIFNEFLAYWIKQNKDKLVAYAYGVTFQEISKSNFKTISISLPPLPQQYAIAKILQTVKETIRARRDELRLEHERKAALMDYLFTYGTHNEQRKKTEIGEFPESWQVVPVGSISESIVPGRNKPKRFTGTIPWITIPDIRDKASVDASLVGLGLDEEAIAEAGGKIIPSGSVIMSCVGEFGIVTVAAKDIVINQQLHAFTCPPTIDPYFICHALRMQKHYMETIAAVTTIPYMNKNKCNSIPIPLPTLDEQREIAKVLKSCDTYNSDLECELSLLEELFLALLEKLMTGRLSTLPLIQTEQAS